MGFIGAVFLLVLGMLLGGSKNEKGCAVTFLIALLIIVVLVSSGMSVDGALCVIGAISVGIIVLVLVKVFTGKKDVTNKTVNISHDISQRHTHLINKPAAFYPSVKNVTVTSMLSEPNSTSGDLSGTNQRQQFEKILEENHVPNGYKKVFIANSRFYQILDCPAIIWNDLNGICILVLEKKPRKIHLKRSWIKIVKDTSHNVCNNINANYLSNFVKEEFKDYCLDKNFNYQIVNANLPYTTAYIELNEKSAHNVLDLLGIAYDPEPVLFSKETKLFVELDQIRLPEAKETELQINTCIDYSKLIDVLRNILNNLENKSSVPLSITKDYTELPVINLSKKNPLDRSDNTSQRYKLILESYEQQFAGLDKFEDVIYAYTQKSDTKELNNSLKIRALSYYLFKNEITIDRIAESDLINYISKKSISSDNDVSKNSEPVQALNNACTASLNTLKVNLAEQKLISDPTQNLILGDEKISSNSQHSISENKIAEFELPDIEMAKSTCSSEPIQQKVRIDFLTTDKYKLMKQISPKSEHEWVYTSDENRQFYQQAKFMEAFEDTYNNNIEFMHYQPKYIDMTSDQLRWYFTWRAKVRKGEIVQTSLSYMYVYTYELLNQIGANSCEDALDKLIEFWEKYRVDNAHLDRYLPDWIYDYIIYYGCDIKKIEMSPYLKERQTSSKLMAISDALNKNDYSNFAELLNSSSFYKIFRSKFFNSQYGYTVNEALSYIMVELKEFYDKNRKTLLITKLIGKPMKLNWRPFRSAVVFEREKPKLNEIVVNDFEKYQYEKYGWEKISYYNLDSQFIGQILRTTEMYLRELLEYPHKIKTQALSKDLDKIIKNSVEKYCRENGKEGIAKRLKGNSKQKDHSNDIENRCSLPREITIDTSKFDKIRRSSDKIQEKLIVEGCEDEINLRDSSIFSEEVSEKVDAIVPPLNLDQPSGDWHTLSVSLSDVHLKILKVLVKPEDVANRLSEISSSSNMLLEVLLEEINEKSIDSIGDNIIEGNDNLPYIYDDYIGNVINMLKEIKYNAE